MNKVLSLTAQNHGHRCSPLTYQFTYQFLMPSLRAMFLLESVYRIETGSPWSESTVKLDQDPVETKGLPSFLLLLVRHLLLVAMHLFLVASCYYICPFKTNPKDPQSGGLSERILHCARALHCTSNQSK